jgi:hypothetical protein
LTWGSNDDERDDIIRHAIALAHGRYRASDLTLTCVDVFTGIADADQDTDADFDQL